MNFDININGIMVHATYSDENISDIFIPLLKHLGDLQAAAKRRILVMLAAPPGAGKSTLCEFLKYLSDNTPGLSPVQVIGMDGFHRYQDYLCSHTAMRDGEEVTMVKIKGAPVTFDLPLLEERIKRVSSGEDVGWPVYDRMLHNPTDNAIKVRGSIVLLEGNYLLLKDEGWNRLASYADYTIKITASEDKLYSRLLERKIKSGTSPEDAAAFVKYSDLYNVRTCLADSAGADLELMLTEDGFCKV